MYSNKKVTDSAHRIRELLDFYHITQTDFSRRTGINKAVVSTYASGKRIPKADKIYIISQAYSVNPAWLMGVDVPMLLATKPVEQHDASELGKIDYKVSINKDTEFFIEMKEDESRLVSDFRNLSEANQQLVLNLISSLKKGN